MSQSAELAHTPLPSPTPAPPRPADVSRVTSNLGALPAKATTINLETLAMGWGEGVGWGVESRLKKQHGMGRAGTIGKESAVRRLTLQRALRRAGGLKMQDIGNREEREEKEGKMRGRTKLSSRSGVT